jgi:hypothetical protein
MGYCHTPDLGRKVALVHSSFVQQNAWALPNQGSDLFLHSCPHRLSSLYLW